jgi:hypothetical protein
METINRKNRKLTDEEFRMLIECSLNDLVSLEEDEDEYIEVYENQLKAFQNDTIIVATDTPKGTYIVVIFLEEADDDGDYGKYIDEYLIKDDTCILITHNDFF